MNKELRSILLLFVMLQLGVGISYADPTNIKDAINDDVTTNYTITNNETMTSDIGAMGSGKTEMSIESSDGYNFTVDGYDSAAEERHTGITIGDGQTMNINNMTLKNMESPVDGGAIYNKGALNITKSTFSNNGFYNPTVPIEGKGAAIYNEGVLNIVDTTFSNNMVPMYDGLGGAIYSKSDVTIEAINSAVVFSANVASLGSDIYMAGTGENHIKLNLKAATTNSKTINANGHTYVEYCDIIINDGTSGKVVINALDGNNDSTLTIKGGRVESTEISIGSISLDKGTLQVSGDGIYTKTLNSKSGTRINNYGVIELNDGENKGSIYNIHSVLVVKDEDSDPDNPPNTFINSGFIQNKIEVRQGAAFNTIGANKTVASEATKGIVNTVENNGFVTVTGGNIIADISGGGKLTTVNTVQITDGVSIEQGNIENNGTLTNLGNLTANSIINNGTMDINGGNVIASDSTKGITNTSGVLNISSTVQTPVINADGNYSSNNDTINIYASLSDTSTSDKIGNAVINYITAGAGVSINTNSDTYSINNSVVGNGILMLNGSAGIPETASSAGKTQFTLDNTVNNATVALTAGQLNLPNENNLTNTTIIIEDKAALNTINGSVDTFDSNINFQGTPDIKIDIDVLGGESDNFANASEDVNEVLTDVNIANLDKVVHNNTNINLINLTGLNNIKISPELQNRKFQAMTPIRIMEAIIDGNGMMNIHPSSGDNDWRSFNPAIMASPVTAQMGGYLTQLQSYDEAFYNMDMYMLMTASQRHALKNKNKVASIDGRVFYDSTLMRQERAEGWFRPYATFEKVPLKNGPKVENIAYGTYMGGESQMYDLGHGWDGIWGAYVGYNGSHQNYDGVSIYQNGGILGVLAMVYKGNFFTGLTLNAGASAGEASTMYGNENFAMLMAGIASKTGYNWELVKGKFIIQPSWLMSYSFVNTFDYTNAAGVRINSDPLHAIQLQPEIKFICNLKNGWQPYASVAMIWNIMDDTKFKANDVALPEMSIKPYIKYGVGLRKTWGERFTGFFQTYLTNGGRNGVGLQAGFTWTIGKSKKSDEQKIQKSLIKTPRLNESGIVLNGHKVQTLHH